MLNQKIQNNDILPNNKLDIVSVRLVHNSPLLSENSINSPAAAVELIGKHISQLDREILCLVNLKSDGTPINASILSLGALNAAITQPREIFKTAFLANASSIILIHNHPSGNVLPSKEDCMVTDRINKIGEMMEISLTDHIIVGPKHDIYFSFREKGLITKPLISYKSNYENIDLTQKLFKAAEPNTQKTNNIELFL